MPATQPKPERDPLIAALTKIAEAEHCQHIAFRAGTCPSCIAKRALSLVLGSHNLSTGCAIYRHT